MRVVVWESVTGVKGEIGLLEVAIGSSAGALDGPDGGVDLAVSAFEGDLGGSVDAAATEEVSRIGLADLLVGVVEFGASAPSVEAGRFVVKCEAEGVEEGGFSGPCGAGDGE